MIEDKTPISKAELARQLGISRTYVTLLIQGRRQPSSQLVGQLRQLQLVAQLPPEFESVCVKWAIVYGTQN
jgi:transcriptional regulator with XRE-family HTH domain